MKISLQVAVGEHRVTESPDGDRLTRLTDANRLLQLVLDTIPVRVFFKDRDGNYLGCNKLFARDAGMDQPADLLGKDDFAMGWRDQAELYRADDFAVMESGVAKVGYEEPQTTPTGQTIWLRTNKIPLRNAEDEIIGVLGTYEDITRQKELTEEDLHREKLEAIGRLAGGVAHDFNNMLTAIDGALSLIEPEVPRRSGEFDPVETIRVASARAADLTRQLLAFARQQVIQPQRLDPHENIRKTQLLLDRLLGAQVKLEVLTSPDAWSITMDPGQFEQLLVNLALNASDAMPDGGTLTFETNNVHLDEEYQATHPGVEPGPYLQLVVSDTGVGMDPLIQKHVFEPFFTTKGPSRGMGLGLATCHGIVNQNGGHIWLYSEPGQGTTFKIYLPRAAGERPVAALAEPVRELPEGTETILVVEDEEIVRHACATALGRRGYRVLEADSVANALEVARGHDGPIDALICDVILPDGRGPEIPVALQADFPDIKVLYASGYTENTIACGGTLEAGINFIQKPYTPGQIERALRSILDA